MDSIDVGIRVVFVTFLIGVIVMIIFGMKLAIRKERDRKDEIADRKELLREMKRRNKQFK